VEWEQRLEYQSTVQVQTARYSINVALENFFVHHYDQLNAYPGWRATANIGGFGYFMVFIHTVAMILVGLVLTNDSKFLRPAETETTGGMATANTEGFMAGGGFQPIGGERSTLL